MPHDYRPQYHFIAPAHWMNDPNGPLYYEGMYHMFYQHRPAENLVWGHARSADLLHWEHLPYGIQPAYDEIHCFSGCATLADGVPTILYTSIGEGPRNARTGACQRLARSHDGMLTWETREQPVLTQDIHEEVLEWRDPFVWREDGRWYLVLGGGRNGYGVVLLYTSQDLVTWRYVGVVHEDRTRTLCECPNLLTFGERRVLIYSPGSEVAYHSGKLDLTTGHLTVTHCGILDPGGWTGFYAPNTLLNDPKGRLILWGWSPESGRGAVKIEGYEGALTVPRELSLDDEGRLCQRPVEEMEALRALVAEMPMAALSGQEREADARGIQNEIVLEAQVGERDEFYLDVFRSRDGLERTRIRYDGTAGTVSVELGMSSRDNGAATGHIHRVAVTRRDRLDLRVFLDGSMLEVFVNEQQTISTRAYPGKADADGIVLGGYAKGVGMRVYEMRL